MINRIINGLRRRFVHARNNERIEALAKKLAKKAPKPQGRPVLFFNASTRLGGMSLNAGFSLLSAWALKMAGIPVVHFVCWSGLKPCILGTRADKPEAKTPCHACISQSLSNYTRSEVRWMVFHPDSELEKALQGLSLQKLAVFEFKGAPLGNLVLPSVRWILRRYNLEADEKTLTILRQYILSAWNVIQKVDKVLEEFNPRAVVVFNGLTYPEAALRWAAQQRNIPAITHEVNLAPFSAYFTTEEATFRSVTVPPEFELDEQQSERLDAYLEQRFQGNFKMAGIQFWNEMHSLGEDFYLRASGFKQIVPVFTNVIFDTSQGHANTVFPDMFVWLDMVLEMMRNHAETLFVLRAHPDESRPGKASRESVAQWVERCGVKQLANVLFVDSNEKLNSYELIRRSKFVMVYNSTVGLEATLLGTAALCAGRAHYTQLPTVYFPQTPDEYRHQAEKFLTEGERIPVPEEFIRQARRFLYYQYFISGLPFGDFLKEDGVWQGYVVLKKFDWEALQPEKSSSLRAVVDGIMRGKPFILKDGHRAQ